MTLVVTPSPRQCRLRRILLMKLTFSMILFQMMTERVNVSAWTPSSFHGGALRLTASSASRITRMSKKWTMYQEEESTAPSDHPNANANANNINAWTVLTTTERWISQTLANANAEPSRTGGTNPYVRKEVSYYCEPVADVSFSTTSKTTTAAAQPLFLFAASIFRHLKEIRLVGEQHIQCEMKRLMKKNSDSNDARTTLRQTHVIVIPSRTLSQSFVLFDQILQTVNQIRRNARDYYASSRRPHGKAQEEEEDDDDYYSVSINCAHLHPLFGSAIPTTTPTGMTNRNHINSKIDESEENDPRYQEYQKQRLLARQSPYPTIVMEVRVSPTPTQFLRSSPLAPPTLDRPYDNHTPPTPETSSIAKTDIQKLEALFGQSAYIKEENIVIDESTLPTSSSTSGINTRADDNYLWDHVLGTTIPEFVVPKSSKQLAQEWISLYNEHRSNTPRVSFTSTNTTQVDEAYEYVFTNIAMLLDDATTNDDIDNDDDDGSIYYLVFSHFLPHAATSFDKFTRDVELLSTILLSSHGSTASLTLATYHPEHIQATHRSPVPILAVERMPSNQLQ